VEALRRIDTPILAVPYAGSFASIGDRILVAWNGGPESTRAVNEALPLLCGAKAVMVLLNSQSRADPGEKGVGTDILDRLTRHGVAAKSGRLFADKEAERGTSCSTVLPILART
jgi:hypothetical protein